MNDELELLLAEIDLLNSDLALESDLLDEKIQHELALAYTYESNRLEGGGLTLAETEMAIKLGLMMPDKTMTEYLATIDHYQAVLFIRQQAAEQTLLSEALIKQIHSILLRGINHEYSGIYRTQPLFNKGEHIPPAPEQLPVLMSQMLQWQCEEGQFLHPVIFAAEIHQRLMSMQLFLAANGQCARLLMNLVLLEAGYPLANISGTEVGSAAYYHALELANCHGQKQEWYRLIVEQVKSDIESLLQRLRDV
jgi:Fic family protein